jgi:3-oxoadipate enol-lactonase
VKIVPFVKLGDVRIQYVLEGPADASVLVFLNSLGTDYSMWDAQAAEFQKKLRVLRCDTRGHGKSSVTPGPYSIEQLGEDVVALLDELRLGRVHFCGLSMGGMIGMWLGFNAPQRLNKLVLCNTGAKIGTSEAWASRMEAVRRGGMKAVASAVMERWFTPAFREKNPAIIAGIQKNLEETSLEGYVACCAAVRDFDCRDRLKDICAPTLVIAGAHDPATPPSDGRILAEQIPVARYAELNAAHLSNIEDRDRFNSQVSAFLSA